MLKELFDFFDTVFRNWSGPQIAALVVGILLGIAGLAFFGRLLGFLVFPKAVRELERERDKFEAENQALRERSKEEAGKHRTIFQLFEQEKKERNADRAASLETKRQFSAKCDRLHEEANDLQEHNANLLRVGRHLYYSNKKLGREVKGLQDQVQVIMEMEGKFWERPPAGPGPAFRPRDEKAAPIIALLNLKGGVGKTTLTANLGARLWKQGLRVLQVDLDHQGTLTSLCLTDSQVADANRGEGKLVNNVLQATHRLDLRAWQNLVPLPHLNGPAAYLLPANKFLANVEEDLKARWLLNKSERDARFLLREALHAPLLQTALDVILLDCPPRITTGCINALACADFVLVPVLLDKPSTDAVPNLLGWLRSLKEKGVCPHLALLGIVANRTHFTNRLTHREKTLWAAMHDNRQDAWKEPAHFFRRITPGKALFAEAADKRVFAAFEPDLEPIFASLVEELVSKKVLHENRRLAVVSV